MSLRTQTFFNELGFNKNDYPFSHSYSRRVISMYVYIALNDADQEYISNTLRKHIESCFNY